MNTASIESHFENKSKYIVNYDMANKMKGSDINYKYESPNISNDYNNNYKSNFNYSGRNINLSNDDNYNYNDINIKNK